MHALKAAGFIALAIALLTGSSVAANAPQDAVMTISATVMDGSGADRKSLDFACTVESQDAVLGAFHTTQSSLMVSRPLMSDLHMTCSKPGYEPVRFQVGRPGSLITGDFAPHFTAARAP